MHYWKSFVALTPSNQRKEDEPTTESHSELPVEILLLSGQFPFKNIQDTEESLRKLVRNSLPSQDVAFEIAYTHYARFSWTCVLYLPTCCLT
jgi:hypothetical protein